MMTPHTVSQKQSWFSTLPLDAGALSLVVATVMLFGLELERVFVADAVFVIDQSRRIPLALTTLSVFATPLLAPILASLLGWSRVRTLAVAGLWVTRLLVQGIANPVPRVVLAALGVMCWGWAILWVLRQPRYPVSWGLLAGVIGDLCLRAAWQTIDLPWMQTPLPQALTAALVALSALGATWEGSMLPHAHDQQTCQPLRLAVIGPALGIDTIVVGNPGFALVHGGQSLAASAVLLGGAIVVAWTLAPWLGRHWLGWAGLSIAGGVGLWLAWQTGTIALGGCLLAAIAWGTILSVVLQHDGVALPLWRAAFWLTLGFLIHVAALFWYYSATGDGRALVVLWGAFCLVAAVCWPQEVAPRPTLATTIGVLVLVGLLIPTSAITFAHQRSTPVTTPLPATFSVMTYNIQSGFARDHRWSLEETARTIESVHPDVVVLQEISRGWLVTTGADDLLWLSARLGMHAVWGPASRDGLWGNAILTRAPIERVEHLRYPQTQNLYRGALLVALDGQEGTVWIATTHLDDPRNADAVRLAQTASLLTFLDGRRPLVLGGDFNADPGTPVIRHIIDAGLADTGQTFGPALTTSSDARRIDYLFASPELAVVQAGVIDRWSSDHRPVVAWFRRASRP